LLSYSPNVPAETVKMNVVILNPINAQPVTVPETAVEILAVPFNIQCSLIAISS
jgi:hypothetical protein